MRKVLGLESMSILQVQYIVWKKYYSWGEEFSSVFHFFLVLLQICFHTILQDNALSPLLSVPMEHGGKQGVSKMVIYLRRKCLCKFFRCIFTYGWFHAKVVMRCMYFRYNFWMLFVFRICEYILCEIFILYSALVTPTCRGPRHL